MYVRLPHLGCAVLVVGLLVLGGCGNGESADEDPHLLIETLSIDGPPPAGVRAALLTELGLEDAIYDLDPVPGRGPHEFGIRGGPEGRYEVRPPPGWGSITGSPMPPEARRNRAPARVRIGRASTLYLGPLSPTLRPGSTWGASREQPDGTYAPLKVRVEVEPPGFVVALRFDPSDWHGSLLVMGRLAVGAPGAARGAGRPSPLAEPLLVRIPEDGGPVLAQLQVATTGPIDVILVPAAPAVKVDGETVRIEMSGLPVEIRQEAMVRSGAARYPRIPDLGRPLHVTVGDSGFSADLLPDDRERAVRMRLLHVGGTPTRSVEVVHPADVKVDQVQVRPASAVAYGRVPFEASAGRIALRLPREACAILLRAGSVWAAAEATGTTGDEAIESGPFLEAVPVKGRVYEARPGCQVRFFRHLGEEAVLGDGFECRTRSGGQYEALLPPGTYRVEVIDATGTWTRAAPIEATVPGRTVHLPLESPD